MFSRDGRTTFTRREVVLVEELSRRAASAIENARLYAQACAAVKARDEFLSIASHELRTPLTSMRLRVGMMRRHIERSEMTHTEGIAHGFEVVGRQIGRLEALVSSMLDVSRTAQDPAILHPERMDLAAAVTGVCERFSDERPLHGSAITQRRPEAPGWRVGPGADRQNRHEFGGQRRQVRGRSSESSSDFARTTGGRSGR